MSIQIRLFAELEDEAVMPYSLTQMSSALTWTFLAALIAATATRLWLALRQIRHVRAHRGAVPRTFAEAIPLASHQKAADYTVAKARLGLVSLLRRHAAAARPHARRRHPASLRRLGRARRARLARRTERRCS
jgi:hypothetical protein